MQEIEVPLHQLIACGWVAFSPALKQYEVVVFAV
jgi:hypothetical protein